MRRALVPFFVALTACAGVIEEPANGDSADPADVPVETCVDGVELAPPARLWVLTDSQHTNAIRDLLGPDVEVPEVRTPGVTSTQFVHEAGLHRVSAPLLSQYQAAAEAVAVWSLDRVDAIAPCDAGSEVACGERFVADFAARAFRRPLGADERAELLAIYDLGATEGHAVGVALVIEAVLQAPDFLYRTELGEPSVSGEIVELTPYELASSLSFLLLDSIPDAPLWQAARDGSLSEPGALAEHATRLLELPRARAHVEDALVTWIGVERVMTLEKDPAMFPMLDDALRASMIDETRRFIRDVLWERDGSLAELLSSSRTYVDGPLAELYGVDAPAGGAGFIELDPTERAGLLTQASVLATLSGPTKTSIVHRGLFVNRLLLCLPEIAPPPPDLIDGVAAETDGLSERELADYRASNTTCAGCHAMIDPPGIALEHYDPIGRWRTDADGAPVDATARVAIGGTPAREITGAVELARALAESDEVTACVAEQIVQYAFGRALGREAMCSRADVIERFEASDRDVVEIFRAIPATTAFRTRRREAP